MGRKRLIVQADLTSEEDQAFLAWIQEKLCRRRLAEEIREGLRRQYSAGTGQAMSAYPSISREVPSVQVEQRPTLILDHRQEESSNASNRLQKLVQSF